MERWYGVLPGTWSVCCPCCACSVHPEPSERTAGPSSCGVPLTESWSSASPHPDCTPEDGPQFQRESVIKTIRAEDGGGGSSYQGVEGGHREDSQASQHALGGPAGHSEEALGVWELAALQAGQIAPQPEQVQVQFLQVLLPLLDLNTTTGWYTVHGHYITEAVPGPQTHSDTDWTTGANVRANLILYSV